MARIVKQAGERKAELIDCAQRLFFEKGYEATTVADILERTGLSKGAFYHHFSSKEELLHALIERLAAAMLAMARSLLEDDSISELTRLSRFIQKSGEIQFETQPVMVKVYAATLRPENALMYQQMVALVARIVNPVLDQILQRGVERGEFDVPDTALAAEIIVQLSNARQVLSGRVVELAKSGDLDAATELLDQRLDAERRFLDRMLGLAPGAMQFYRPGFTRTIVRALAET